MTRVDARADQPRESGEAPWYLPVADEVALFEAAHAARIPVLLQGPTGCGKTRFVEHMAWRLATAQGPRETAVPTTPLITVACHEDLTANDLVGRHLLLHDRTTWVDGPLTRAVREGAFCYLDEVVEARQDTTAVIHALADHRRLLAIEKTGEQLRAHPDFQLVMSYNPGYQSRLKDLKPSMRQRFVCLTFHAPDEATEAAIVAHEGGIDAEQARALAALAAGLRRLDSLEGPVDLGSRPLVHAAQLVVRGIAPRRAAEVAVLAVLPEEPDLREAARQWMATVLP